MALTNEEHARLIAVIEKGEAAIECIQLRIAETRKIIDATGARLSSDDVERE